MSTQSDTDERARTVSIDHSPATLSAGLSVGAGLLAVVLSAPFALAAIPFGLLGLGLLAGGLFVAEDRSWVSVGAAGVFASALIAGAYGLSAAFVLPAVTAAVLSWDVGQNAIDVGHHLGRDASTRRMEVFHAAMSTLVSALGVAVAFGLYLIAGGSKPASALVLVLVGVVLLVWALRN